MNWKTLSCWAAGDDSGACAAMSTDAASAKSCRGRGTRRFLHAVLRASGRFVLGFVYARSRV